MQRKFKEKFKSHWEKSRKSLGGAEKNIKKVGIWIFERFCSFRENSGKSLRAAEKSQEKI